MIQNNRYKERETPPSISRSQHSSWAPWSPNGQCVELNCCWRLKMQGACSHISSADCRGTSLPWWADCYDVAFTLGGGLNIPATMAWSLSYGSKVICSRSCSVIAPASDNLVRNYLCPGLFFILMHSIFQAECITFDTWRQQRRGMHLALGRAKRSPAPLAWAVVPGASWLPWQILLLEVLWSRCMMLWWRWQRSRRSSRNSWHWLLQYAPEQHDCQ